MLEHEELWLCGQWRGDEWEFQGIFSTKLNAIAACRNENYFIAPVYLDLGCPDEHRGMPNCEFPLARKVAQ